MTPTKPFRVGMEFRVGRRVGWEGEEDLLRDHLDAVLELLRRNDTLRDVELVADLRVASLHVYVTVDGSTETAAEEFARAELGEAIRQAGAFHENLLPLKLESQAKSNLNAWAGLRTPRWQHRRAETALA